ncbi:MAG: Blue (Type 1) copper domain protein [Methanoculleus marisnigri]|uniref:Blue (Type 1) copper domain protein n=1 Tax=Methanoculleus marisnigri TaxID=2198 RepID=A0A101GKY2_9EURY|nr:MAG: Blue (Type 1) copper domain protein [Methanoculleus marisnigri]
MKPNLVLLVALLVVGAGILAAGCTAPGGNVTQPTGTGTPTATETVTTPTGTGTPTATETVTTPTGTGTPTATETANVTTAATTVAGGEAATIDLAADNLAFNASTITVPAGAEVTINFDNQDVGILHNFAVYTDSSAAEEIFVGETITGPAETTYTFTAPEEPGTYFFRCDVHPQQMTGDFVVE